MNSTYDFIYLSPHLDDVALSCGGQVFTHAEEGKTVLIVTVMAGDQPRLTNSTYIQELHTRWKLQNGVAAGRRAEDRQACRILGADFLHLQIPDCIYRFDPGTDKPNYLSDEDIFGEIHPSELDLISEVADQIRNLPKHDQLVVPLGVGNHVDHQIIRRAAQKAAKKSLLYYEEYPYAADPQVFKTAAQLAEGSWQATIIFLSEAALAAKIDAIACYKSQLSTFYQDRADMEEAVRKFTKSVGGERVWRRIEAV